MHAQYFEHGDTGSQIQIKIQDADGKSQIRCRGDRWFESTKRNTIVIAPTACAAARLTKQFQQLGPRQYAPGSNNDFFNLNAATPFSTSRRADQRSNHHSQFRMAMPMQQPMPHCDRFGSDHVTIRISISAELRALSPLAAAAHRYISLMRAEIYYTGKKRW